MERSGDYEKLTHALQSGIAYIAEREPDLYAPKHTRVGINMCLVETGVLAKLLIAKGLVTTDEYERALLDGLREEVDRLTARVNELYGGGGRITLA